MSPSATRTGLGRDSMCHCITLACGASVASWAPKIGSLVTLSAVLAGIGVKAKVPSAFLRRCVASAKYVAVTGELQVESLAAGLGIAQTLAVTKGNDAERSSYTLVPTTRKCASWPSFG